LVRQVRLTWPGPVIDRGRHGQNTYWQGLDMNKFPTHRNFGYGKQLDWAGHQALLDLYGRGHYATVATHARRWSRFCDWAMAEHGIRDARHIDQNVIEDYAAPCKAQVNEESLSVSYAQNLLSTLNTALEALRRRQDWSGWIHPPAVGRAALLGEHRSTGGMDGRRSTP
jgi:hypothetical protein